MSDSITAALPVPPQQRRVPPDPSDLLAAVDAEVDALADHLHDGVLQALVVARYATDAAVRGGDPKLARDAVQEALVGLRRTVWLLRPRGHDDLCGALSDLSGRCIPAGMPPLELDLDPTAAQRLSPIARATAYRFVQAATADGATAVSLHTDGDTAVLTVGGGGLADPAGWSVRAAALGGGVELPAQLRLPLSTTSLHDSELEGDR